MDTKLLKQKILDLAIRGKLVPQDPNDEPASVLLERIRAEREQLIKQGKLKRSKSTSDNQHYENVPFEIPSSWVWVRLGQLYNAVSAKRVLQAEWQREGVPFYRAREIVKLAQFGSVDNDLFISEKHYQRLKEAYGIPQPNDIMLSAVGTIGKSYVVKNDDRFYYKDASVLCLQNIHSLNSSYIQLVLSSQLVQEQMYDKSKGTTVDTITIEKVGEYTFPLPPLAEQIRIVGAVGQWFDVADNLESNKQDLQETVLQAKSKVLELAIQGKLVPQDPNDEPAAELLKRIAPHATPCDTSHYENLPQGWAICRLSDIAKITAGGTPSRKITSYWEGGTIPWLKIADMTASGKYVRTASEYITEEGMKNSSAKLMNKGTLLYTIFASIGEVGILDFDATCNQAIANIDLHMPEMTDYIYYYLKNLQTYMYSISKGCTQQNINQGILKNATIPLPPLAEQKRIVERIETIFASLDTITAEL